MKTIAARPSLHVAVLRREPQTEENIEVRLTDFICRNEAQRRVHRRPA